MWYIIYHEKDFTKLDIFQASDIHRQEIADSYFASRRNFNYEEDAIKYAIKLAKNNGKTYVGPGSTGVFYLD